MQMRVEVLEVPEGLHRHHAAGHGAIAKDGMFQIPAQDLPVAP
ncbi:MAG: hypothetical protein SWH68_09375 [Thermodesulfobacteriota bacterium]|nr:hypothetical protein [Thermodesulfobacteriota bacterium]